MNVHSPKPRTARYRAIWISDFHLGTKRAQAELLLDFLRVTESETLYLVGDIVDNWALKKTWQWDQLHNDVIQKLLRKARKGTRVIYIPGNHDENFRDFAGSQFGRMAVRLDDIHISATGKRYLVMHGDEFDGVVKYAKWLAYLGDSAYEVAISANVVLNKVRRLLGRPYWSLSAYLKNRVKKAVEFLSNFELAMVREAKRREAHGVICGHVHTPEMRSIDGIEYFNDGDWVESCSALVEHFDGTFELLDWRSANLVSVGKPEKTHAHTSGNRRLAPAG
ncbi:MAG: UDP-2,3-diacylglucosamine diphosphatase [Pseudomonadota bacterium]